MLTFRLPARANEKGFVPAKSQITIDCIEKYTETPGKFRGKISKIIKKIIYIVCSTTETSLLIVSFNCYLLQLKILVALF